MSVPPAPHPAAGTHLLFLDGEALLFSEPRQELHAFNTSAAVIWCHLEEGRDAAGLAAGLHSTFGLDPAEAEAFVGMALADWREKGFLAGAPPPAAAPPAAAKGLPPWGETAFVAERRYRLLDSILHLRFTDRAQQAMVHPVLAHLEYTGSAAGTAVDIIGGPAGITVYRDRQGWAGCDAPDALAPLAKSLLWSEAIEAQDFFLNIHAGVVGGPFGCLLLPAPPGSGKSTLTAALVHGGFDYFSDEVALLEDDRFTVVPFPLALCVKDSGIPVLAGRFPALRDLPLHRRGDGRRVAYLPPPPGSLPPSGAPRNVRAIVFPRREAGAESVCRPLSRAEALRLVLGQCLAVSRHLDLARVRALIGWIDGVACHELVYDSLAPAVLTLSRILSETN